MKGGRKEGEGIRKKRGRKERVKGGRGPEGRKNEEGRGGIYGREGERRNRSIRIITDRVE